MSIRSLTLSHNADIRAIMQALDGVKAKESVVYIRREDIKRILQELVDNSGAGGDVKASDLEALIDTMERITDEHS